MRRSPAHETHLQSGKSSPGLHDRSTGGRPVTDDASLAAFAGDLMQTALGFRPASAVLTAVKRDLFNRIGEEASVKQLRRDDEDPEALDRLCRALVGLGLLRGSGETYRCPPETRACLTDEGEHDLRPILVHLHDVYDMWGDLDRALSEGQSYSFRDEDERTFDPAFIAAMEARATFDKQELASILADRLGEGRLLDLAGGSGVYARAVLREAPRASGVVADLSRVITETERYVRRDGLEERLSVRTLDLLEDEEYGEEFDVVLVSSVLHMFGPRNVETILARSHDALNPDGCLAIRDYLLNDDKTGPTDAVLFDLMMLLATDAGQNYSFSEYRTFLDEAGFADVERVRLSRTADDLLLASRR